jgi:hypothetical protein
MTKSTRFMLLFVILLMLTFLLFPHQQTHANMGPPSNLKILIEHFDEDYDLDIFIHQELSLTQAQIDEQKALLNCGQFPEHLMTCSSDDYYQNEYPLILVEFQDKDGFVSNTIYGASNYFYNYQNQFVIYLNVPRNFKLILIDGEGQIIVSEEISMQQYDYTITWNLKDVFFQSDIQYDAGTIEGLDVHPLLRPETYGYALIRLIVTLIIELSILLVFGFVTRRTFIIVGIVNVFTQVGLTVYVLMSYFSNPTNSYGPIFIFFVGEMLIFFIEILTHATLIKEHTPIRRILYAFVANFVSMIVGLIVMLNLITRMLSF